MEQPEKPTTKELVKVFAWLDYCSRVKHVLTYDQKRVFKNCYNALSECEDLNKWVYYTD